MRESRSSASSAVACLPVRAGYLAHGPLTSTWTSSTRPAARTSAMISGRMPLESSFTGMPAARMSRRKSARCGTAVGSPPETVTPSSHPARRERKLSTSGL